MLSQAVVDAGAVPLLLLCLKEPELSLKRIAAATLSDICKHTPELAQAVVDNCAVTNLSHLIFNKDTKLKVSSVSCWSRFLNTFRSYKSPLGHTNQILHITLQSEWSLQNILFSIF